MCQTPRLCLVLKKELYSTTLLPILPKPARSCMVQYFLFSSSLHNYDFRHLTAFLSISTEWLVGLPRYVASSRFQHANPNHRKCTCEASVCTLRRVTLYMIFTRCSPNALPTTYVSFNLSFHLPECHMFTILFNNLIFKAYLWDISVFSQCYCANIFIRTVVNQVSPKAGVPSLKYAN